MKQVTRRDFLRLSSMAATSAGLAALGVGCSAPTPQNTPESTPVASKPTAPLETPTVEVQRPTPTSGQAYLAVARGADAAALVGSALAALGGMERFVKAGAEVIIKPNICTDYHTPEFATTTNPDVVGALVRLCLGAGAKRVRVMDFPFGGSPASAYKVSGIEEAVKAAGGEMEVMSLVKFQKTEIPQGKDITSWDVYQPILEADLVINVPIAKHHSLAVLTLGGKNLLGTIMQRNSMHQNMGQRIADLTSLVRPGLTVVDGYRILMDHGPTGGSLDDVRLAQTIIASHDIVAADAYAATKLFEKKAEIIPYIVKSAEMGLGTLDLASIKIEEIAV